MPNYRNPYNRNVYAQTTNDYGLTTPLPDFGEGGATSPGISTTIPTTPLPDFGEGGAVDPGYDLTTPLPDFGEGGAVSPLPTLPTLPTFPSIPSPQYGQVRFLNASTNNFTVNMYIGNTAYAINSRFATITNYEAVSDGFHTVTVRQASGIRNILLQQTFPFVAGQKVTMVLTDSAAGGLSMVKVVDTSCTNMPSTTGCYRFANMSYSGNRVNVVLGNGNTIFRNIGFQEVSSYKQAAAGYYQMYATTSNTFTYVQELPVLILGAIGVTTAVQNPQVSYDVLISPRENSTTYLIGNSWSGNLLQVLTVKD